MKYENGLISIITPCYNGEKFLDRYFKSILSQTYNYIQLIIVNDGSSDNTSAIIKNYRIQFEQNQIQLIYLEQENQGQAVAINNALQYVTGEFLVWSDCDDYYESDALFSLKKYLEDNSMNFVRGMSSFRNDNDINKIVHIGKSINPTNFNIFDSYIFETDSYTFAGIFMVRMKYFDQCFKDRTIFCDTHAGQNWQLILPLSYNNKCGYLDRIVYNVILTKDSHSRKKRNKLSKIKRSLELRKIIFKTINRIDLSKWEKVKYTIKINYKYFRIIFNIIIFDFLKDLIKRYIKKIR